MAGDAAEIRVVPSQSPCYLGQHDIRAHQIVGLRKVLSHFGAVRAGEEELDPRVRINDQFQVGQPPGMPDTGDSSVHSHTNGRRAPFACSRGGIGSSRRRSLYGGPAGSARAPTESLWTLGSTLTPPPCSLHAACSI